MNIDKLECEVADMSSDNLKALIRESGMFDEKETPEVLEKMMRQSLAYTELHRRKERQMRKAV